MNAPVPLDVIVASLTGQVQRLVIELLPNGIREGHEWRVGSVQGERGRSMAVHLSGGKTGVWSDFSSGQTGDALDLVAAVLFRDDKKPAVKWARDWLGLGDALDPAAIAALRKRTAAAQATARQQAAEEAEKNHKNALRIWLSAASSVLRTPVDIYLCGRACDLRVLGRQPGALRYHPGLFNKESGRHWPAMVWVVVNALGQPCAVHRTWLEIQHDGRVTKAPLKEPKMTLGPWRGGAIRVWRGASNKPWKDMPAGELADLAEGPEDAVSVAIAAPELRVAAAINVANFGTLELPPQCGGARFWRQNDPADSKAALAFDKAIDQRVRNGDRVLVVDMPACVKDVNELLHKGVRHDAEEGRA